ncbi:hypothetical protein [Pseudoxanthomonas jiangsuensis]|uniref:hypothetical protein n=1 Tax=Pseudoxanthomonas jiangsuensis TaxID=619688 RepID=UPI001390C2F5|nr:hypothetical protein [Pseudoxanthomonas jiangsuensis]
MNGIADSEGRESQQAFIHAGSHAMNVVTPGGEGGGRKGSEHAPSEGGGKKSSGGGGDSGQGAHAQSGGQEQ